MASEQTYLTIITVIVGGLDVLAGLIFALSLNFVKQTGGKFKEIFDMLRCFAKDLADEESDRKVEMTELKGRINRCDEKIEHIEEEQKDMANKIYIKNSNVAQRLGSLDKEIVDIKRELKDAKGRTNG